VQRPESQTQRRITATPPRHTAKYSVSDCMWCWYVCMYACLSASISRKPDIQSSADIYSCVYLSGRGAVRRCWRCDKLCYVFPVLRMMTFLPLIGTYKRLEKSKLIVTNQSAAVGAKSAGYDCLLTSAIATVSLFT